MGNPVIRVDGLSHSFTSEEGRHTPVLDRLDLTVERGEFLCLLGPTGCGKTTLLRILADLLDPEAGTVQVGEGGPGTGAVRAGVVFQQNSLLPWRTVLRNTAFPLEMAGLKRRDAAEKARELLRLVRLEEVAQAYPYELSGGMQQRVAIARALAHDTGLLLMDEPFGALDDRTRRILQDALLDLWERQGMTILFITHNIEEALLLGNRVVIMGQGRLLHDQPVDLERPRDPLGNAFNRTFLDLRRRFAEAVDA